MIHKMINIMNPKNNRKLSEAIKKNVAGRQYHKCANKPGSLSKGLKGLRHYKCPLWENKNTELKGCFDEAGYDIDHIIEHCLSNDDNEDNLQALCKMCHLVKTKRFLINKKNIKILFHKNKINNNDDTDDNNNKDDNDTDDKDNNDDDDTDDNDDDDRDDDNSDDIDDKDNNDDDIDVKNNNDDDSDDSDDNNNKYNIDINNNNKYSAEYIKQITKHIHLFKKYKCTKCNYITDHKTALDRHLQMKTDCSKNSNVIRKVVIHICKNCNKIFSRQDSLKKHLTICKKKRLSKYIAKKK